MGKLVFRSGVYGSVCALKAPILPETMPPSPDTDGKVRVSYSREGKILSSV